DLIPAAGVPVVPIIVAGPITAAVTILKIFVFTHIGVIAAVGNSVVLSPVLVIQPLMPILTTTLITIAISMFIAVVFRFQGSARIVLAGYSDTAQGKNYHHSQTC